MAFEIISPPRSAELAMFDPVMSVCDFEPDIYAGIDNWTRIEEGTLDSPITALALTFSAMLQRGVDLRSQYLSRLQSPPKESMQLLLGVHTLTKLLEFPEIMPQEGGMHLRDLTEKDTEVLPFVVDIMDGSKPRLHLLAHDAENMGIPMTSKEGTMWSSQNEIIVRARRPAMPTKGMRKILMQNNYDLPKDKSVTIFPSLKARSDTNTHRCTSKTAVIVDLKPYR